MAGNKPRYRRAKEHTGHTARPAGPVASGPVAVEADLPITLGQFVKLAGMAPTGGDAKQLVVGGQVRVNDIVDTRRGHKLAYGDVVGVGKETAVVAPRAEAVRPGPPDGG